ncbi:glycoside hydrolase family protein [Reichenbachiella versicolor]|uniref:glycoside hydrolase family protein n=1 Tax=Reichenbachiella versicolor TaxID=1821036 RepID=UPI000D6E8CFE|nr:glycoside hydrolase family protein [Reichenbachiella versicolor]
MGLLTDKTWGAEEVIPRSIQNGIEDSTWSYWGGNITQDSTGLYHQYVCRWLEDSPKGHMEWPRSEVIHATASHPLGPFTVKDIIGKGHNPEIIKLKNDGYAVFVNKAYYTSPSLWGPWQQKTPSFDARQRPIQEHMSNLTFAQREDGSQLMICRGGGVWISQTGLPPYYQITSKSAYPPFEGKYEDPVVWRTNIQYHMIVNDWLGRIAYYLRSKDGLEWKLEPGEAYTPGIATYEDGTKVDWYKYERIKILQDEYGRAYQANFAVCDTIKRQDKGNDHHSSKNIGIPLIKGRLLSILNDEPITKDTKQIKVLVKSEVDFDPHRDFDLKSLRFGSSDEVNYGRGSKLIKTQKTGKDIILIFDGIGNGLNDTHFAAKLLGKTKKGKMLFGYSKLPGVKYIEPMISCLHPEISGISKHNSIVKLEVQNFGQVTSPKTPLSIEYLSGQQWKPIAKSSIDSLAPYQKTVLTLPSRFHGNYNASIQIRVMITQDSGKKELINGPVILR